jgi:hypothetical protein
MQLPLLCSWLALAAALASAAPPNFLVILV